MTLLFFAEFYFPRIGGAEKVVQMVAEHAASLGWDCHVLTTGTQESHETLNGVQIHRFPLSGNMVKRIRGDLEGVKRFIRGLAPDMVFVYALQTWGADLFLSDRTFLKPEAKVILVPCGLSALSSLLRKILYFRYFRLLKQRARQFDHYIFHTQHGNDYRFYTPFLSAPATLIPNPAAEDVLTWDKEKAVACLKARGLDSLIGRKIVLNVSNHYKIKGHEALISHFLEYFPSDYKLVIAGTHPTSGRSCITSCSKAADGNPRIHLLEGKDRELVLSLYHVSTLFFLSSSIEYVPLVLLEAQAARLPFLSFPVGNAVELAGGIVLPPKAFSKDRIEALLANETKLAELAAKGYEQVQERYRQETVLTQYVDLFRQLAPSSVAP